MSKQKHNKRNDLFLCAYNIAGAMAVALSLFIEKVDWIAKSVFACD